ncbi:phenylacetic acid degradation protein PaaN [Chromobacterium sp. S0633]|uniref:phenylacetic acid degradation protein PaaN n=1 Tax=Chromobacterium sp. S0633 TaxID=2957805 RepID=UPI0020A1626C|nr:phenylacetic acid degradation protein PaaN [Chromobacterium sp. S0633]MCP1290133.1 phenylacetic acid degradation protein PaaN [Chromobacterium sp. S0633]
MSHPLFQQHQATLDQALQALSERQYWSPHPEMPSPRTYGETAAADGQAAFEALLQQDFQLDGLPAGQGWVGSERSPYRGALRIRYPRHDADALLSASTAALQSWRQAGPQAWVGVCLEIIQRLNRRSFEIAHAVMHTTGQAFMMAFQAGGPHAQDRALEAVTYAWREMSAIPGHCRWSKPQGKHEPLVLEKSWKVIPRGVGLVIGCSTFPTWNGYPGLFASLATGNSVIVKPHPGAVLPLALTVRIAREVLAEAGFDPNTVLLAANQHGEPLASLLAQRPEVKLIDFTGSSAHGEWLESQCRHAQVYTEKAGVNCVVLDSTADFPGLCRNLALSLALYSGQMCTAPQNIFIPADGIHTPEGKLSYQQTVEGLCAALEALCAEPAKAVELLGALQNPGVVQRLEAARALGRPALDSRRLSHPQYPEAEVRTPLLRQLTMEDRAVYEQEHFGPISFLIQTPDSAAALRQAEDSMRRHGALSFSVYSTDQQVQALARQAAENACVSLALNFTGAVMVNQSAAFSDFHGSGGNPAANASLSDSAFVANRFRVAQTRSFV